MPDVVALAEALIAQPSLTGAEAPAVDLAARWLSERGWLVTLQELSPGRANIWASHGHGAVTLSTHLGYRSAVRRPGAHENRLTGRGACDAKGIAAAMMVAAQALAEEGEKRVDLLFVVGEEKSSDGARAANTLPATSRFLDQRRAHRRAPRLGREGLDARHRAHARAAPRTPPIPSSALGAHADARAPLDARGRSSFPTDRYARRHHHQRRHAQRGARSEHRSRRSRGAAHGAARGRSRATCATFSSAGAWDARELEFAPHIPAQHFHTISGFETAPVSYTSDIPLLDRWGTPLLFGPGSINVAHTPDEFIDIDELRAAVDSYIRLVRTLLAS